MDKTIYIIDSIYHGKNEDLYEAYPHVTLKGAEEHLNELAEEFIKEHEDKEPLEKDMSWGYAFIEYGDLFSDNLTLGIVERVVKE